LRALSLLSKIKRSLVIISKWEYTPLCLLIIMMLVMHFATIMQPRSMTFDEKYYIPAAKSILHGESLGEIEHPPLGQTIIASGIWIFGDNPFGWRFFSIISGAVALILFYLICRELKLSKYNTLLATTLLAIDNLSFVQSSIATLDVFCLTFMFASAWFYLKKKYIGAGIFVGLATVSKLSGVFALLFITIHWLVTNRKNIKGMAVTAVTSALSFLTSLFLLDFAILHKIPNLVDRIHMMLHLTQSLTFTYAHQYLLGPNEMPSSRPWEWLYNLNGSSFGGFDKIKDQFVVFYVMVINPAIWILIIPSILFLSYLVFKHNKAALFSLCWFAATYIIWIPITLITNRLTYNYYFYPAIGAICVGIALLFSRVNVLRSNSSILKSAQRLIIPLYLGVSILFFIILFNSGNIWFRAVWAIILFIMTLYYLDKFTPEESISYKSLSPINVTHDKTNLPGTQTYP